MSAPAPNLTDGRLKLRHLTLILMIAECRTIGGAADALSITQPAVTRSLQDIERILGTPLFERSRFGVRPTPVGTTFLLHARQILAQLTLAAEDVVQGLAGLSAVVRIATNTAGSDQVLMAALQRQNEANPDVVVVIREAPPGEMLSALLNGEVDLAVGRCLSIRESDRLKVIHLYSESLYPAVRDGHELLERDDIQLKELVGYLWVLPGDRTTIRANVDQFFLDSGYPIPRNRVECSSILTAVEIVKHGPHTITPLTESIINANPTLHALNIPLPGLTLTHRVIYRKSAEPSAAARGFVNHLLASNRSIEIQNSDRSQSTLTLDDRHNFDTL
ncbi:MAG: LysR family transcriptional regulator [Actinobacteria bacterium]|uniref:Unannotated protein n=1 Tax=freshwater metagenome TaxID=449393 RepID=A0A6J7KUA9_9ZZZZ|nr:LysR family transcriptional regulator [Actinomycetota bacterium]